MKRYPVFRFHAVWTESADGLGVIAESMFASTESGRVRNDSTVYRMTEFELDQESVNSFARIWIYHIIQSRIDRDPRNLDLTVTLMWRESWCPGWFFHYTFDCALPDSELIESFSDYVERMRSERPDFPLMIDYGEAYTLCRCEECQRSGFISIGTERIMIGD